MRSISIRTKLSLLFILGTLLFTYGAFVAFATPPGSPYLPAETLDPNCAPGDPNCSVVTVTGSNGITVNGVDVTLGGTLTGDTFIDQDGNDFFLGDSNYGLALGSDPIGFGLPGVSLMNSVGGFDSFIYAVENTGAAIAGIVNTGVGGEAGIQVVNNEIDLSAQGSGGSTSMNISDNSISVDAGETFALGVSLPSTLQLGIEAHTVVPPISAEGLSSYALNNTGIYAYNLLIDSENYSGVYDPGTSEHAFFHTYQSSGDSAASINTVDDAGTYVTLDLFTGANPSFGVDILNNNNSLSNRLRLFEDTFIVNDDDTTWGGLAEETKMFFDISNQTFRLGSVNNTEWEGLNVGDHSMAFGFADIGGDDGPIASGDHSFAFGNNGVEASGLKSVAFQSAVASGAQSFAIQGATASASYSTAFGLGGVASGINSTAFGLSSDATNDEATAFGSSTTASGVRSTAFGYNTIASNLYTTAFGDTTIASGSTSTAFGAATVASGVASTAFGFFSTASGNQSTAFGDHTFARSYGEVSLGTYSTDYTPDDATSFDADDRLFVIGNGNGLGSDAFTILKNGLTGVGFDNFETTGLDQLLQVNGGIYGEAPGATGSDIGLQIRNSANTADLFAVSGDGSFGNGALGVGEFSYTPNYLGSGTNILYVANSSTGSNVAMSLSGNAGISAGTSSNTLNSAIIVYRGRASDAALQDDDNVGGYFFNGSDGTGGQAGSINTAAMQAVVDGAVAVDTVPMRLEFLTGTTNAGLSQRMAITSAGDVGIGFGGFSDATSTGDLLQVNGDILSSAIDGGGAGCAALASDADGTIICAPSDMNLKQDIVDATYGLETVLDMRPVKYFFKDEERFGSRLQLGFLAQELETLVPEVVTNTGEYKSVNYSALTAVLVNAVKELNDKVNLISTGTITGAEIGELVVDTLRARQICLDDICIDRDTLQEILNATGADAVSDPDSQGQPEPQSDVPVDDEPGETPENPTPEGDPQGQSDPEPQDVPEEPASEPEPPADNPEPAPTE